MNIPKEIIRTLKRRETAARKFMNEDSKLVELLEASGVNTLDTKLEAHILTGCESLVNPAISTKAIINYLKEHEKTM